MFIVPNNLVENWRKEFLKWDPYFSSYFKVQIINKSSQIPKLYNLRSRMLVLSYETLKSILKGVEVNEKFETSEINTKFFSKIELTVFDEIHMYCQGDLRKKISWDKKEETNKRVTKIKVPKKVIETQNIESQTIQRQNFPSFQTLPAINPTEKRFVIGDDLLTNLSELSGKRFVIGSDLLKARTSKPQEISNFKDVGQSILPQETKKPDLKSFIHYIDNFLKNVVKSFSIFISGSSFRNSSSLLNLAYLMKGCNGEGIDFGVQDQLKDAFSGKKNTEKPIETSLNELLPIVKTLKTILTGKVYLEQPNLTPKLFHSVTFFPPSEKQMSQLPSSCTVGNKNKIDRTSLHPSFLGEKEWKKVDKDSIFEETGKFLETESPKLFTLIKMLEKIYDNRIDYEKVRKKLANQLKIREEDVGISLINKDEIEVDCYEKIIIVSKWPNQLKQLKELIIKTSKKIKHHHFISITGEEKKNKRTSQKLLFEESKFSIALVSTKVGGVGLTFDCSRYMFLLESEWDHTWMFQTIYREYRLGQDRDVHCFSLLTSNGNYLGENGKIKTKKGQKDVHRIC